MNVVHLNFRGYCISGVLPRPKIHHNNKSLHCSMNKPHGKALQQQIIRITTITNDVNQDTTIEVKLLYIYINRRKNRNYGKE